MALIDELKEKRAAYVDQLANRRRELTEWSGKVVESEQMLADLDLAISALSPKDEGLLDPVQQETSGVQSASDQDKVEKEQPLYWYASGDEEYYNIGPCDTREAAIDAALGDEIGISDDLKRQIIFVMQAAQTPLKLSRMIDVDSMIDRAIDGFLSDAAGHEGDPNDLIDHIKKDQWDALEAKLREAANEWQAEQKIVVSPCVFDRTSKAEYLCYLYVNEKHVLAQTWEETPDEFVREGVHVADGDTYWLIDGEWFGPVPADKLPPPETSPDAERIEDARHVEEGSEQPNKDPSDQPALTDEEFRALPRFEEGADETCIEDIEADPTAGLCVGCLVEEGQLHEPDCPVLADMAMAQEPAIEEGGEPERDTPEAIRQDIEDVKQDLGPPYSEEGPAKVFSAGINREIDAKAERKPFSIFGVEFGGPAKAKTDEELV